MKYNLGPYSSSINYAMVGWHTIHCRDTFLPPNPFNQHRLPFITSLDFSNLDKLVNDPICNDPSWPVILGKLHFDIPKFEGKLGENPSTHITTHHLLFSSNSLVDDSKKFHIFKWTLTNDVSIWYIELDRASYSEYVSLAHTYWTIFNYLHEMI